MADKSDLTPEQLDALEYEYGEEDRDDPRVLTLVAMARAKQAAERERDALRVVARIIADAGVWDWHTELSHWVLDGMPDDYDDEVIGLSVAEARAALAQSTDAGGAE